MTEDRKPPEGELQQPPYAPIPAYYLQGEQNDQINLGDYIRVLWRRRFLILLGTLLCALTAFVVTVMGPPVYQTRATLILQPSQISTKLKPETLSIEALKTMLESDFIASRLRSQLLENNVIRPDSPIEQIQDMLSVEIPVEPLIDLVVEADSPEKAEIVANTWAEIFVGENASLTLSSQQATLDFIESQYPVAKNSLIDRQAELKEGQENYEQALMRLDGKWSSRIVDFSKETERLQKEHEKDSERLRLEFNNRWKLDLLKEELYIKAGVPIRGGLFYQRKGELSEFEEELLETEIAIKTTRNTLTQIKKEIQSKPQYLVLSKAITDEALWDKIGSTEAGLPEELNQIKLRSELLNPIYQSLLQSLTTTQIEYDTLVPKSDHLRNELESIREAIDELYSLITQKEIELFALLTDRELEKVNLLVERQAEFDLLKKMRESEMTGLGREGGFQVSELTREVDAAWKAYEPVAERYRSIELAKVQGEPYVQIGALAVAPGRPLGGSTSLNTLIALVVGFMLTVMLAFVFEYAQSMSLTDSPKREIEISPSRSSEYELDSPSTTTHGKLAGR